MTAPPPVPAPPSPGHQRTRSIPSWPGWLCLAPAVLLLIGQVVVPSVRTLLLSAREGGLGDDRGWVGLDNYAGLQQPMLGLIGGLLPGVLLMIGALLFAFLVGALGGRSGGAPGIVIRVLLGLLLVCYAPIAMLFGLMNIVGIPGAGLHYLVQLAIYLPIAAAAAAIVGLTVFAAADRRVAGTAVAMSIAGGAGALAWSLQATDLAVVSPPGPLESLAYQSWRIGFTQFQFGYGAAINVLLLILIGLLGVLATVAVLQARIRIDIVADAPRAGTATGVIALVVAAAGLLALAVVHHQWIIGLFRLNADQGELIGWSGIATAILNSWVPSGIGTLLQVAVALLAGAGIGYFQPVGAGSRWLLLIFAPWMFTGIGLLAPVYFMDLAELDLTSLWINLIPRLWVVGPAIVVFSWLFAAVRRRREQTGSITGVMPAVGGVIGLTTVILWLVQSQGLAWNLVVAAAPDRQNGSFVLVRALQTVRDASQTPLWLPLPLPILLVLAAAAVLSVLLIRNLRISSGPA